MIKRVVRGDVVRFQVYGRARVGDKSEKVYVGTYDSRKEAEAEDEDHRVTQRKIASGELPPEVDLKRTLKHGTDEWLLALGRQNSRSLSSYRDHVRCYIVPVLGGAAISQLSKGQVIRWRDGLTAKLAPKTVNVCLGVLSSAFRFFVDCGWCEVNPCHGIRRLEVPDGVYTWIRTREEITKLLIECPRDIREIVAFAVGTGMRLDEILHLHHADVDIERRLIAVHRGRQGPAKSGRVRWIPILDAMLPLVRELALKRGGAELVFPGEVKDGKVQPRSKAGVQFPFKQAVLRAGLPTKLRFHDLRHTMASHWVLSGGDIFRLSRFLGHSSVVITQKFYAHLAPEAWEQDYHRVSFHLPAEGTVYALTKRKPKKDSCGDAAETASDGRLNIA
jgi:integrase